MPNHRFGSRHFPVDDNVSNRMGVTGVVRTAGTSAVQTDRSGGYGGELRTVAPARVSSASFRRRSCPDGLGCREAWTRCCRLYLRGRLEGDFRGARALLARRPRTFRRRCSHGCGRMVVLCALAAARCRPGARYVCAEVSTAGADGAAVRVHALCDRRDARGKKELLAHADAARARRAGAIWST